MNETTHLFQVNVEDRIPTEGVGEDVGHPKPAMKSNHHEELVRKVLVNNGKKTAVIDILSYS